MVSTVSLQELNWFHTIDRELYARLVIDLCRDVGQSMLVLALWMWLEHVIYNDVVKKIKDLPDTLVNALADEAVTILRFIDTLELPTSLDSSEIIPLIQILLQRDIPLQFFLEKRPDAIAGISKMVNDVCSRSFKDIVQKAMEAAPRPVVVAQGGTSNNVGPSGVQGSRLNPAVSTGVTVVGDVTNKEGVRGLVLLLPSGQIVPIWEEPHLRTVPIRLGEGTSTQGIGGNQIMMVAPPCFYGLPIASFDSSVQAPSSMMMTKEASNVNKQSGSLNPYASMIEQSIFGDQNFEEYFELKNDQNHISLATNSSREAEVHDDSRTMFITFSKGYPVSEQELHDHIIGTFGDCVEAIYMQEVPVDVQALYARVVFRSADNIIAILAGQDKAKFSINGRHVWARRFVTRSTRTQMFPHTS